MASINLTDFIKALFAAAKSDGDNRLRIGGRQPKVRAEPGLGPVRIGTFSSVKKRMRHFNRYG